MVEGKIYFFFPDSSMFYISNMFVLKLLHTDSLHTSPLFLLPNNYDLTSISLDLSPHSSSTIPPPKYFLLDEDEERSEMFIFCASKADTHLSGDVYSHVLSVHMFYVSVCVCPPHKEEPWTDEDDLEMGLLC